MPNWCSTNYTIKGEKDKVKKLYDLITKLKNQDSDLWFGDISNALGGTEDDTARGWVDTIELSPEEDQFTLYCNTAWDEPFEWRHFVEDKADVFITYTAVEPGCELYITNDKEILGQYLIDDSINGEDYPHTEQEVIDYVNQTYKQHCKTIDDCHKFTKKFNENNEDDFIYIHQFMDGE